MRSKMKNKALEDLYRNDLRVAPSKKKKKWGNLGKKVKCKSDFRDGLGLGAFVLMITDETLGSHAQVKFNMVCKVGMLNTSALVGRKWHPKLTIQPDRSHYFSI